MPEREHPERLKPKPVCSAFLSKPPGVNKQLHSHIFGKFASQNQLVIERRIGPACSNRMLSARGWLNGTFGALLSRQSKCLLVTINRGSLSKTLACTEVKPGRRNDLLHFRGYAAFYQARDLSENSAAVYPAAPGDGACERRFGNSWRLGPAYPPDASHSCMGPHSSVSRSISREHIHGDEPD
jgi:hypothetical protein